MSESVKLFNVQAVKLLAALYERFPFPLSVQEAGLIGQKPAVPEVPHAFSWFVSINYSDRSANQLTADEREEACKHFSEAITDEEPVQNMLRWKAEVERLPKAREEFDRDRDLLVYTICFLNEEGYVRILKDRKVSKPENFDDQLISESLEGLKLTLTSKGFAQLSKTMTNGKIGNTQNETVAEMVTEAAKASSGKAADCLTEEVFGWAKLAVGAFVTAAGA